MSEKLRKLLLQRKQSLESGISKMLRQDRQQVGDSNQPAKRKKKHSQPTTNLRIAKEAAGNSHEKPSGEALSPSKLSRGQKKRAAIKARRLEKDGKREKVFDESATPLSLSNVPVLNRNQKRALRKKKAKEASKKKKKPKPQSTPADDVAGQDTKLTKKRKHSDEKNASDTPGKAKQRTSQLQQAMKSKLKGAQFRYLNEQLYTTSGETALQMMKNDPSLFDKYHEGYRLQVEKWPQNPNDIFIEWVKRNPQYVVGDFGCGEGKLAESVTSTVHSFDLVAHKPHITSCNLASVPLQQHTLDVAIFCLSLMGVDFLNFIQEAHRVLKPGGLLKIAEVISRFDDQDVSAFIDAVQAIGFKLTSQDSRNKFFVLLEFVKTPNDGSDSEEQELPKKKKRKTQPTRSAKKGSKGETEKSAILKPCIYKRR
mmetsp:Transcript_311/g.611  ORF Transcript_311/g.611 Transcript_311/m.611 type:complete len:425 (-) Transcript_311:54-1328(-)